MPWLAAFFTWSCIAAALALLAGLVARDRLHWCYSLGALAIVSVVSGLVFSLCPSCRTWDAWIVKESIHALAFFAVALELGWRVFRQVPTAWWWARASIVSSLMLAIALVMSVPPGPISVRVIPWVLAALAWLYTLLGLVAAWHRMPEELLHRAILWGVSPYLMLYAATWGQVGDDLTVPNLINPLMALLMLSALAWIAWQPDKPLPPDADQETVYWLHPWRRPGQRTLLSFLRTLLSPRRHS